MDDLASILNGAALPLWVLVAVTLATPILKLATTLKEAWREGRGLSLKQQEAAHAMGIERGQEKSKFIDTLLRRLEALEAKNDKLDEAYHALLQEVAYLRGRVSTFEQCGQPECPVRSLVAAPAGGVELPRS